MPNKIARFPKTAYSENFRCRHTHRQTLSHNSLNLGISFTSTSTTIEATPRYGDNVIADVNAATGVVVRTYVTPILDQNVSMTVHGTTDETYFYNQDERSSVMNLTDGTGAVAATYAYSAYGDPIDTFTRSDLPTFAQRYQFTGRESSEASGDYYFRSRFYSSGIGSFMSRDPLVYVDGLSLYAGWFTYRIGTDPTGTKWVKDKYRPVWTASEDGDTLYTLAFIETGQPSDWTCIKPLGPQKYWDKYPVAKKCAKATTKYLHSGGRVGLAVGAKPRGGNGFDSGVRRFYRASGWKVKSWRASNPWFSIAQEANWGKTPLRNVVFFGHSSHSSYGVGSIANEGSLYFTEKAVKKVWPSGINGQTYNNAVNGRFPPRCWFHRKASIYLHGCSTAALALPSLSKFLRRSAAGYGSWAEMWPNGFLTEMTTGDKIYGSRELHKTVKSLLASKRWQSRKGTAAP